MVEFVSLEKLTNNVKKYNVKLRIGNKIFNIKFGDSRYEDYTQHHDKKRRQLYLIRHKKNEDWDNPLTPGFWSKHLLWGETISIAENLKNIRKNFLK